MSQVIVRNDHQKYHEKKLRDEEKGIHVDESIKTWQKSDATKTLTIEKIIAAIAFPIALFWGFLLLTLGLGLFVLCLVFKGIDHSLKLVFGKRKNR